MFPTEHETTQIIIQDNWGNRYPFRTDLQMKITTVDEAKKWLQKNFESYILDHWKWTAKECKRKVSYPDSYTIKKVVTHVEAINEIKSHEFNELEMKN